MNLHTHSPDQDHNFYVKQNEIMQQRYSLLFKKRKLSWNNYITSAKNKLGNNIYFMWIFLCGLDTFLKANNDLSFNNKSLLMSSLYKDAEDRIYRIIGDSKKNEEYIRSL
jgi:hypothetical protein